MRRVAHIISAPDGIGGAERVVQALVSGAPARGWAPTVLNPFTASTENSALKDAVAPAAYAAHRCTALRSVPRTRSWLAAELDALRPDLIHVHLPHAMILTATLRQSRRAPVVFTHHHGDYLEVSGRRLVGYLDRQATRRADVVVGCSERVTRYVGERCGLGEDRLVTIYNGWSGTPLAPRPPAGRPPTIVCVARLRREKGHRLLVRAFARVVAAVPTARLVLVGDGPERQGILSLVDALGLTANVQLQGTKDDVWPALADADVFALASRYETMGLVLVEAMAAGLPVAATSGGGIPELVRDGREGLLVVSEDERAFAEALLELLTAPEERREAMSAAGRARAEGFRVEATTARYYDLYERVLAGRSPSD